ncbi:hypothetical protein [Enterovibrio norvegicus]|uniref:hypothetical protein n=1 Tax=Enterovibrio norvegicus TaxID=188144 RepID=UPI0012FFFBAE|nr:hypothetical protein [Enterovibrio norvegicus]
MLKIQWGSFFSHKGGHALTTRPARFWSKLEVNIGETMHSDTVDRHVAKAQVRELLLN